MAGAAGVARVAGVAGVVRVARVACVAGGGELASGEGDAEEWTQAQGS